MENDAIPVHRRKRPLAPIVITIALLLTLTWFASRFLRPAPRAICTKLLELHAASSAYADPSFAPSPPIDGVDACVRVVTAARAEHSGPRARLVQANVARCILHANRLEEARACAMAVSRESLWQALLHFP